MSKVTFRKVTLAAKLGCRVRPGGTKGPKHHSIPIPAASAANDSGFLQTALSKNARLTNRIRSLPAGRFRWSSNVFCRLSESACHTWSTPRHFSTPMRFSTGVCFRVVLIGPEQPYMSCLREFGAGGDCVRREAIRLREETRQVRKAYGVFQSRAYISSEPVCRPVMRELLGACANQSSTSMFFVSAMRSAFRSCIRTLHQDASSPEVL